ncbi:hypothetical protein HNV11_01630 [Spirosoma taeanense]|uniref:Uncharacterized protein n=1 Tax=Spirosoma taeanense TaxID=2735870 RepID=A0A6M5Y4R1_9BACT|nr:hypothetical protein [Spirosoma taeanense]QJW88171.1 hypothetical protein HNV11_01630 [Spirosoma taeanense]
MATTSPFDPDKVDPEFYSHDPNQHGDSDYGRVSEGVGNAQYGAVQTIDRGDTSQEMAQVREENVNVGDPDLPAGESYGGTQEWDVEPEAIPDPDVPKGHMMSEEAGRKLEQIADNPSDDALFHRGDATYLEEGDNPNEGYDPHNKGYDGKDKNKAQ